MKATLTDDDAGARLPLHAQKAVVGRLLGLEVLAPQRAWLESQGYQDAADVLVSHLCWFTNQALVDPDSSEPLTSFLVRLVSELQAQAARLSSASKDAVVPQLDELATLVKSFCASPYDPLGRLVAAVTQTAADFYQAYGTSVPSVIWRGARSHFSFQGGQAGLSFAPDIYLQVRTEFTGQDQPASDVRLRVAPKCLDVGTAAALPRVLLHEFVAHVPQGPYHGPRVHPDVNDSFAEGWMDYIAHRIHRAVLELRGPYEALADHLVPTWTGLYETAAEHFFAARCPLRNNDRTTAARSEGAAAARQVHDLLRKLSETSADPDTALYRLSFDLNASSLDSVSRWRMVAEIRRCLVLASRSDVLVTPLRDWLAGRASLEDLSAHLLA